MSKAVVGLALSQEMSKKMFRIEDLDRLHAVASVRGPMPSPATLDDLRRVMGDASVLITGWGTPRLTQPLLVDAPKLKLVAHSAGSVKGLVEDVLFDRNIRVTTAAAANAVSVAQFTVGMMISMLKQVPWIHTAYAKADQEDFRRRRAVIRELMDMEIGIIGASRVGREVIALLRTFPRLTLKCYDPYLSEEAAAALGVTRVSLQDACRCEIVTIHAPNLPETHRMFNARTLALLPDHGLLINTSRGALVDEDALVLEMKRRPLYVCLDVTDPEPPKPDSPLRTAPNLLLTPHIAGAMQQACKDMGKSAIDEVLHFLAGEPLNHEVTRAMMPTQA
ncbi:MAG: hydroxyacid dehydrogenase [Tepidisphaeraceae bacterium]